MSSLSRSRHSVFALACLFVLALLVGCAQGPVDTYFACVTNGISSFGVLTGKGAEAAGRDLGVKVEVIMPPNGVEDQKRLLQVALTRGVAGVAVSPINPDNQVDVLDEVAARTLFITQDSDAPNSKRLCYVGMDNYEAGRMAGRLVKEALPNGGSIILFVGRLGQLNAAERRRGVIDEVLDRPSDPSRVEPPDQTLKGDKYTVLDTRTDDFDLGKAKVAAQDAIAKYPDLGCMVGLFAYNPPKCLAAVREAGKVGQIQLVGFDEEEETLQGIIDGEVYGTVVQNPYEYGYQSIKLLKALAAKDAAAVPAGKFLDIPARSIRKDNVQEFWGELKKQTGK